MAPWQHRLLVLGASFVVSARGSPIFTCDGGATALEQKKVREIWISIRPTAVGSAKCWGCLVGYEDRACGY